MRNKAFHSRCAALLLALSLLISLPLGSFAAAPSPDAVSEPGSVGQPAEKNEPADESEPAGAADASAPAEETAEAPAGDPFCPGDPTGDGRIDSADARLALRFAVGLEKAEADSPAFLAADCDGDPGVTAADARVILRAAVGLARIGEPEPHVHVFTAEVTPPTCTSEGYTTYTCECGETYTDDYVAPAHKYYRFKCVYCGQENPLHHPVAFANEFERVLYDTAHPLFYKTADELNVPGSLLDKALEAAYHRIGKWCCYYTVHDVFRPALKAAGYSPEKIEQIAPVYFTSDKIAKALSGAAGLYVPSVFMTSSVPVYVPSLLMDYYFTHPAYAETWRFTTFYDDMVEHKIYERTENADTYTPQIGDILFMSNKESTYVNGYKTVDHTAQIIQLYEDGSFWCTEGSIIQTGEDGQPRVRERMYQMNEETGAYEYAYNPIVVVVAIARPDLTK